MNKVISIIACILIGSNFIWAYDFMDKDFAFEIISENEKLCALVAIEDNPTYNDDYVSPYTGDIVIPDYVEHNGEKYRVYQIGEYAFYRSKDITSLYFPSTLKAIKNDAFKESAAESFINDEGYNVLPLTTITFQDSPESISLGYSSGSSGSSKCLFPFSSKKLYLGRNVEFYSNYDSGYYGPFCNSIEDVFLGDYVTSIPNGLKIGSGHSISSLRLSPNLTKIGRHAFNQSLNISSIVIPEGVTEIGSNAFYGNSSLKEILLPSTLNKIETYGFSSCSNISVVYCFATTPPAASGAAYSYHLANARLRVPSESVELYKSSATWQNFGEILGIDEETNPLPTLYTVNIHFPEGGKLKHQVKNGESFSFFVHPLEGWSISSVSKNGEDITSTISDEGKISLSPIKEDTDLNIVFKNDLSSSISNCSNDTDIKVITQGHNVEIIGNPSYVSLFNIEGHEIYTGNNTEIYVPTPGIYILAVDELRFKFLIAD